MPLSYSKIQAKRQRAVEKVSSLNRNAAIGVNCDLNQLRVDLRDGRTGRHLLTVYIPASNSYSEARDLASKLELNVCVSA